MAKRTTYHVTKNQGGGWNVKKEDGQRPSGIFSTKKEAVQRGKELVKRATLGQIKIHGQNGKIQTEHTYGKDPYPPEG
ncbi:MAG: DUF2188 domain-containing protein [Desulfatibacillum sp.]|nr:DUF2188 domain-containing protein [Desulfatibacillum sp.]